MARRLLSVIAVLLLVATVVVAAKGYVVILKSGHKIRAREPLRIEGRNAIITLSTGTVASYPLDQVDLVETERYNQLGLGDALLIDELSVDRGAIPTPTPRRALGSVVKLDASEPSDLQSMAEPTPTPTPGIGLQSFDYRDPRVTKAFTQIFDERGLFLYKTSAGTRPEYFFVQQVTDSEREVFKVLRVVAEAYTIIHELHPDITPEALELEMIQTSGKAAGTFRLTPDIANELISGALTVEQFYVQHVIF